MPLPGLFGAQGAAHVLNGHWFRALVRFAVCSCKETPTTRIRMMARQGHSSSLTCCSNPPEPTRGTIGESTKRRRNKHSEQLANTNSNKDAPPEPTLKKRAGDASTYRQHTDRLSRNTQQKSPLARKHQIHRRGPLAF